MSWFDTSGIASLAKNALKEAQKSIDKALDIQDDDPCSMSTSTLSVSDGQRSPGAVMTQKHTSSIRSSQMKQSLSHPSLPANSIWGSFTGSFFDNPNAEAGQTVTTPPSASSTTPDDAVHKTPNVGTRRSKSESRDSSTLVSESSGSIEVVSPPTTPGSGLTSPDPTSLVNPSGSESSVEVLEETPTSDELITVSSTPSEPFEEAQFYLPDHLDIISDDVSLEEDSRSFNTVTEATVFDGLQKAASRSSLHLDLQSNASSLDGPQQQSHLIQTIQQPLHDDPSHLSDSTQSFEYVNQPLAAGTSSSHPDTLSIHETTRTVSPASSAEDRSDIVKITSSGHTSGDDMETATSSDIEIISSPNGCDSSSTNSVCKVSTSMCQSSQAVRETPSSQVASKKKGHFRESSTHSIQSTASDDSRFGPTALFHLPVDIHEVERLRRRLAELSEVLEARELKLMDMGRENATMHEQLVDLQTALDSKQKRDDCLEVSTVTEEYTQRLSALEKKFQQSIRERDNLRDQLKAARNELTTKVTQEEMETMRSEKDFLIGELQSEGEKLSKQVLQHSNIIKKLRVKEKESDAQLKSNREQLEELNEEVERLKKTLSAKDEVERTQIEAVHNLSSNRRKLDKEVAQLRSKLEDAEQKLGTVQTSFDAAKREIHEKQNASAQLTRTTLALSTLEAEKVVSESKTQQLLVEVTSLREKLRQSEGGTSAKEQSLRHENQQLLRRLEDLEQTLEQQADAVTTATIPLVRQLEAIQSTLNQRTLNWESLERSLLEKLDTAQSQLKKLSNSERLTSEKDVKYAQAVQRFEEQLAAASLRAEQASGALQQRVVEFELSEQDWRRRLTETQALLDASRESQIETSAEMAKLLADQQKRADDLQRRRADEDDEVRGLMVGEREGEGGMRRNISSPTLSLGRMSLADSLSSNLWPMEDIDCISSSGRPSHPPGSLIGAATNHHTSLLESLQSNLKQRDGENHQLQWELSRMQSDRNGLMAELSNLTEQINDLKERNVLNETTAEQFSELQRSYDALLQMYGEKVDEVQELQLDLVEAKEIYRAQLDELMQQLRAADLLPGSSSN